ncbi:MAG: hypothetical protein JWR19_2037, partial [Pedosphaera sp.]|nr:hypothetical protein [Pedosphaera sp.]
SLIQADGQVQLQFSGLDGYPYVIEASTNLQDWIAIGTAYPTNGLLTITDPDAAGLDARFYRSLIAP